LQGAPLTPRSLLKKGKQNENNISEVIKQAILNAKIEDTSLKLEKLYQISAIGNNLNQISKHCNQKKVVDKLVLVQLKTIEERLNDL